MGFLWVLSAWNIFHIVTNKILKSKTWSMTLQDYAVKKMKIKNSMHL